MSKGVKASIGNYWINKNKKMKSEQIKKMTDNNVDIILGDFNSDFELFLGINNEELINYFKNEAKLDDKQIKIWNTYIYNLLKKNNIIIFVRISNWYENILQL